MHSVNPSYNCSSQVFLAFLPTMLNPKQAKEWKLSTFIPPNPGKHIFFDRQAIWKILIHTWVEFVDSIVVRGVQTRAPNGLANPVIHAVIPSLAHPIIHSIYFRMFLFDSCSLHVPSWSEKTKTKTYHQSHERSSLNLLSFATLVVALSPRSILIFF